MNLKIIGAFLVIAGCGSFGFLISATERREESNLKNLYSVMEYMECELQHRLTPLPQLCRQACAHCAGYIRLVFEMLATQLEMNIHPDAERCMENVLANAKGSTSIAYDLLLKLGNSLGQFGLEGQVRGIQIIHEECRLHLERLLQNQNARLRSYKTLGLCAGAALAILFV